MRRVASIKLEDELTSKRCIEFIVGTWCIDGDISNLELPDGRVVSLMDNAVGSKRKAIVIKYRITRTHYSPTSEASLRKILSKCT